MNTHRQLERIAQQIDLDLKAIREVLRQPAESEFARSGLTGPQRSVMEVLVYSDGLSLKDLSRRLGLAHSTVSGIVDRLAKRGLVERHHPETDSRLTIEAVSPQVRRFMRHTLPALRLHPLAEALSRARPAERAKIAEALKALRRLLESCPTRSGTPSPSPSADPPCTRTPSRIPACSTPRR